MSWPNGELKDWDYREMVAYATWKVIQSILKGELEFGVESAIRLSMSWQDEQKKKGKNP